MLPCKLKKNVACITGPLSFSNVTFLLLGYSDDASNLGVHYAMNRKPRGLALIINNAKFQENGPVKLGQRVGSEQDAMKMKILFKWLQFEVIEHENCTAADMKKHVRTLALEDHTNYDCCVLFLMSHGLETGVYGTDGEVITLEYITKMFSATFSPTLAGKPRLIFIQACRGREPDRAVPVDVLECPSTDANTFSTRKGYRPTDFITSETGVKSTVNVPSDADIFIAFASSFTHAALRNTTRGGWFVDKLYDVIKNDAPHEDLMTMMTKVTNFVSQMKSANNEMQCPQQLTNLTKKLFFFPMPTL